MDLTPDAPHPTADQLRDFAAGRLDARQTHWVERHLPNCSACLHALELLPAESSTDNDPLLTMLRQTQTPETQTTQTPDAGFIPHALRDHPRYRVVRRLGDGGMGAVYLADHRLLDRPVVIKVIRPDLVQTPELLERFQREARFAAKLAHPNVIAVYEAEQIGQTALLVMEYVAGETFAELVRRRGPTPTSVACELIRGASAGLRHVHEQQFVHRDVKPSNLMITPIGGVKVMDLGVAFLTPGDDDSVRELTRPEQSIGTVDYTAPEQWEDGHAVDLRADIYSLGCTLYFLLTGVAPYAAVDGRRTTLVRQLWAHSTAPVPDVRDLRPDVPEGVAAAIARAMAKRPDERFASAPAFAAALEGFADGGVGPWLASGSPSADAPTVRPCSRRSDTSFSESRTTVPAISVVAPPSVRTGARVVDGSTPSRRAVLAGAAMGVAAGGMLLLRRFEPDLTKATAAVPPTPTASSEPIRVGVLHSLSGTMAISERPVVDATLLAIDELNARGGVLGRPVEAIVADGASDGATFAREAENLIVNKKVVTVFGCWTSASRRTVKPVFEKHDHLLFYPVQYEGLEQSPNIIYTGAAPNQQILPAVRWCRTVLGKRRFFLVGSDYVFPRCANAIIHDCASALGAEIVGEAYLPLGVQDASAVISEIDRAKPDMILNTINGDSNVAFYRALRALRSTAPDLPVMSFSIAEEELRSLSAADMAGDYAAWNYFMSIDRETNHAFVRRFQERYGRHRVLTDPMEAAYFGVHLWARAADKAKSTEVAAIHRAVAGQSMDAPEGTVTIDGVTQHTSKVVRIGKIVDSSTFEVIYTSENPIRPEPYPTTRTRAEWDWLLADLYNGWQGHWAQQAK